MDLRGAYCNTKAQIRALEALLRKLPDLDSPVKPSPDRRKPHRARQLDSEQVQQLVESYQAGAMVRELAKRFAISRETVRQHLRRHGVSPRTRGLSPEQIDEAIRLYEAGWSLARIGERLGVNAMTVRSRLVERGVRMRDAQGRER